MNEAQIRAKSYRPTCDRLVISVILFDSADEVLALANDTNHGLGGAVWSQNGSTTLKMAHGFKAGTVWVNYYGTIDPNVGLGGI